MNPRVLNIKRDGSPNGAIYIGRKYGKFPESKWHNPFHINRHGDREDVIQQYYEYLMKNRRLRSQLEELRGKDLLCWCAPKKCHGDILIKLANGKL